MQRLGDVQRDGRADQLEQQERSDGQTEGSGACSATSKPVPSSTLAMTSPRNLVSRRLTTNAGESFTNTQSFFSPFPTARAVASVGWSVRAARTTSTSGIIATGLKKWNPTTRSG